MIKQKDLDERKKEFNARYSLFYLGIGDYGEPSAKRVYKYLFNRLEELDTNKGDYATRLDDLIKRINIQNHKTKRYILMHEELIDVLRLLSPENEGYRANLIRLKKRLGESIRGGFEEEVVSLTNNPKDLIESKENYGQKENSERIYDKYIEHNKNDLLIDEEGGLA